MKLRSLFLIGLMAITAPIVAQGYDGPEVSDLEGEDMADFREEALECADYLLTVSYDKRNDDIKIASAFMIGFLSNTSDFSVVMAEPMVDYGSDRNSHLMMVFMAGWAKYALENPELSDDHVAAAEAGFKAVVAYFDANEDEFRETSEIEDIKEMIEDGELTEWVEDMLPE